jgi:predicted nucleic acid-binding protein
LLGGGQATFHVPDLFYVECTSIFRKKVIRGVCSPADAARALADIQALPLVMTPTFALAADALTFALAHGITAYDACYVALAQRLGVPLISADKKLLQDLAGVALVSVWLGHWAPPTTTKP